MLTDATIRLLLIEDEDFDVYRIRNTLKVFGDSIQIRDIVSNGDEALALLERKKDQYDIVIMDLQLSGGLMGAPLIRAIKKISHSLQIIVVTKMTINITDYDFANSLLKSGAYWYCTKYPTDIEEYIYQPTDFVISILNAYEKKVLENERSRSERKLLRYAEERVTRAKILGISGQTQKVRGTISQLATSDAPVLISGSSGVGKELVATHIHYESNRKLEQFVPINCGGIPDDLIESELFGYEKGAFTGADRSKQGLFEVAHHGTLFLDEIGELPLAAQVKLLRVIQEGEIEKIGRTDRVKVDVRIIAATNKNLHQEVLAGRFREDLFYRLNVLPVHVTDLKDRPEDVLVLWEHFLRQMSTEVGVQAPITDEAALQVLQMYPWPGNVRELKNAVQRVLLMGIDRITETTVKEVLALDPSLPAGHLRDALFFAAGSDVVTLREMERQFRIKYITFIRDHSSSDAEAARKLGLARSNYHRLGKELGLK